MTDQASSEAATLRPDISKELWRKLLWRLMPLLCVAYIISYMDRVLVGYAKLQMSADIGLSAAAYGFGAGIFFIGYALCEVPSNTLLQRLGAKVWLSRIMITWGIITVLTAFVQNAAQFYVARFLLGVAEAGFYPGVLFFLSLWFPQARYGKVVGLLTAASSVAGLFVGPLSGTIMTHISLFGLAGWQSLFIVMGVPAIAFAFVMFAVLRDTPEKAPWLTSEEREELNAAMPPKEARNHGSLFSQMGRAYKNVDAWLLGFCLAALYMAVIAVGFWLPTLLQDAGVTDLTRVGFLSAIPEVFVIAALVIGGVLSDRLGRTSKTANGWIYTVSCVCAIIALLLTARFGGGVAPTLIGLSAVEALLAIPLPVTWFLVNKYTGSNGAAAASMGIVNTAAQLGSFGGPYIMGLAVEWTGGAASAMVVFAAIVAVAVLVVAFRFTRRTPPQPEFLRASPAYPSL